MASCRLVLWLHLKLFLDLPPCPSWLACLECTVWKRALGRELVGGEGTDPSE